jgi:peptidoglycan/LPS O-acetylase OafA/YrhL
MWPNNVVGFSFICPTPSESSLWIFFYKNSTFTNKNSQNMAPFSKFVKITPSWSFGGQFLFFQLVGLGPICNLQNFDFFCTENP